MEITLETISQQMQVDKAELKADIDHLESKVDSVKTWFIGLSLSTVLVVTAIITTVVATQLN